MIVSNLFCRDENAVPNSAGSFYAVAETIQDYTEKISALHTLNIPYDESDHILGTMREVSALWNAYRNTNNMEEAKNEIKHHHCLLCWFSMVVCIMIFGRYQENNLSQTELYFKDYPYLKVWKEKIDGFTGIRSGENNALSVYQFLPGKADSTAGCCSDFCFVIPPKQVTRKQDEFSLWKTWYFRMIESPEELENTLHQLEITQKILLFSSVERLPEKEKNPLGIIKKILIELFQEEFNQKPKTATIPCKKIGAVSLFRIISGEMQKECLLPYLMLLKLGNTNKILYPFTEKIIDDIESGICLCVSVKMQLETKRYITPVKRIVRTIQIFGTLQYPVKFEGNDGTIITSIYTYSLNKFYSDDDIIFFSGLPTFCMYPDIPFEYETNCQQYTYFLNRASRLPVAINEDMVDMKKVLHLDIDCESTEVNYITTRIGEVAFIETKMPRHLIKVIYDNHHEKRVVGSILNLRTITMQYPPLLGQEKEIFPKILSQFIWILEAVPLFLVIASTVQI